MNINDKKWLLRFGEIGVISEFLPMYHTQGDRQKSISLALGGKRIVVNTGAYFASVFSFKESSIFPISMKIAPLN